MCDKPKEHRRGKVRRFSGGGGGGGGGGRGREGEQGALLFSRKVVFITLNSVQGGSNLLIMWMKS